MVDIHPRLSALRINKIAATAPIARELTRPIRTGQRRLFRALPALIWRVRYSKVQTAIDDMSLMASLDLEVAYITGCRLTIDNVRLSLRGGDVKPISDQSVIKHIHKPGDQLTSLYKITPDLAVDGTPLFGSEGHLLTLEIKAKVLVSEDCQPQVSIGWQTAVDFSAEQNSALVKAAHRLSNPLAHAPKIAASDSTSRQEADGQQAEKPQDTSIHVTLTISGPPQVTVGEMFHWSVFIVNRSDKTRKLAVLVVPRRRRDYDRQRPLSSASSIAGYRSDKKDLLANAVVDENIVYAKQKNARTETADLICLTTDIRIGYAQFPLNLSVHVAYKTQPPCTWSLLHGRFEVSGAFSWRALRRCCQTCGSSIQRNFRCSGRPSYSSCGEGRIVIIDPLIWLRAFRYEHYP